MTLLVVMNLGFAWGVISTPAIGTPPRERILYVGQRNNGIIIPPRLNTLYVPARSKLIHDF